MSGRRTRTSLLVTIAIAAVFGVFWVALGTLIVKDGVTSDFLDLYLGPWQATHGQSASLHQIRPEFARERGSSFQPVFVRPPFYAIPLIPITWVPWKWAFTVWVTFWSAVYIATGLWAMRRFGNDAIILASLFAPAALGIAHGEDCPLLLAVVVAAFVLLERNKPLSAGLVLAAGLVKFHLFVFFPLLMLLNRKFRMLAGFCIGAAIELLVTLAFVGVPGIMAYVRFLTRGGSRLEPSKDRMLNLHSVLLNFGVESLALEAVLIAGVIALVVLAGRNAPEWRWFTAAMAGALLCVPHTYGYDATYLLLGLWAAGLYASRRSTKAVAMILATPLPYGFTLAGQPWGAIGGLSILTFLMLLAAEARAHRTEPAADAVAAPA